MDNRYRPVPGTPLEDLDTPCLILDMDAVDHNMDVMAEYYSCLLYTSPSPRDGLLSSMPSSA